MSSSGYKIVALCGALMVAFAGSGQAQTASQSKTEAIKEFIRVIRVDETTRNTFNVLITQYSDFISNNTFTDFERKGLLEPLTPERKIRAKQIIEDFYKSISAKTIERLNQEVGTAKNLELLALEAYDKLFTESEINELIAFYKTPVGSKFIRIAPQISTEVSAKFAKAHAADVERITKEVIDEQLEDLAGKIQELFPPVNQPKQSRPKPKK